MMVWLFSCRVLSSEDLRIVAPLMAALEAAMMVKSLPVIPKRTSLQPGSASSCRVKPFPRLTLWVEFEDDVGLEKLNFVIVL